MRRRARPGRLLLSACLALSCATEPPQEATQRSPDAPAPDPRPGPPAGVLQVGAPTSSRFEGAALEGAGRWGCAGLLDLDGDGRLDVVLGSRWSLRILPSADPARAVEFPLPRASQEVFDPNDLHAGTALGCASADFDGDGRRDLALVTAGGGQVMFNEGGLRFTGVSLPAFTEAPSYSFAAGATAVDADGDGLPELYVGRNRVSAAEAFERDGCNVDGNGHYLCGYDDRPYPGAPNVLLQNLGGRRFAVRESGAEDTAQGFTVSAMDLDGDGRQDLLSCNDGEPSRAYLSRGDLRFEDATTRLGLAVRSHCMGISYGDLDGDGVEDLALSDLGMPLVMLRRGPRFAEASTARGFTCHAQDAWGTHAEDLDNDGDLDLLFFSDWHPSFVERFAACGSGLSHTELTLYRNNGEGYFRAESAARLPFNGGPVSDDDALSGGQVSVSGDVDGDGALDLLLLRNVVYPNRVEPWLLRGVAPRAHGWIEVEAPRGAVVEVCVGAWCQRREVTGERSYGAMHPDVVHVGLGAARRARVRVRRVNGGTIELGEVPSGSRLRVPAGRP